MCERLKICFVTVTKFQCSAHLLIYDHLEQLRSMCIGVGYKFQGTKLLVKFGGILGRRLIKIQEIWRPRNPKSNLSNIVRLGAINVLHTDRHKRTQRKSKRYSCVNIVKSSLSVVAANNPSLDILYRSRACNWRFKYNNALWHVPLEICRYTTLRLTGKN